MTTPENLPSLPGLPPPFPTLWLSPYSPAAPSVPEATTLRSALRGSTLGPADRITPPALWAALNNGFRWKVILRLAAGEELTAPQAGKGADLRLSTVRKHLRFLRGLGVVDSRAGRDRRSEIYYLPEARRPEPGVLDYGSCRIVLAEVPVIPELPPPKRHSPPPPPPAS